MALLRDDKVTVRRGGLTTARYREVMITPIGQGLNDEQAAWLDRALVQAGATQVPRFPRLVTRLGAPATGPTDLPVPVPFDAAAPFKRFVSQLMARRLREIVKADLAIRGGDLSARRRWPTRPTGCGSSSGGCRRAGSGMGRGPLRRAGLDQSATGAADSERSRPAVGPAAQRALSHPAGTVGRVRCARPSSRTSGPAGRGGADRTGRHRRRPAPPRRGRHRRPTRRTRSGTEAWQEIGRLQWVLDVAGQVLPDEPANWLESTLEPASGCWPRSTTIDQPSRPPCSWWPTCRRSRRSWPGREFERETDKARRTRGLRTRVGQGRKKLRRVRSDRRRLRRSSRGATESARPRRSSGCVGWLAAHGL